VSKQVLALLVSVTATDDGNYRVSLDDVEKRSDGTFKWWCHYTNKAIPKKVFEDSRHTQEELADFGFYIYARLNAFRKSDAIG
jgi:hypothetical protein